MGNEDVNWIKMAQDKIFENFNRQPRHTTYRGNKKPNYLTYKSVDVVSLYG
jgi:hypothetical protein